jgi:tight adherence protein C
MLAQIANNAMMPILLGVGMFGIVFWLLTLVSNRNSQAEERLAKIGRPRSLAEIDLDSPDKDKYAGIKAAVSNLASAMEPKSELEKNQVKVTLANAGFRSEGAVSIYQGLRTIFAILALLGAGLMYYTFGTGPKGLMLIALVGGGLFYAPQIVLNFLKTSRQQEIFLTLPDALDLLVVCVESGLGLDAALRKVTEEMKGHAKVICEEFQLANLQLQMGRPRREVLHDLGVRTGVDDVKSLAAILIQADRFGSSIAQALRVQSDSMRTRRRQIAEEKAAKTAVKLIFPLVLFIFPAIFVVLVGPAAIQIQKQLLKSG